MAYETDQMRRAVMGTAIDVDPMEALLWCVRITAGEVAYSTSKVHSLEEGDALVAPVQTLDREGGRVTQEVTTFQQELNLWVQIRQQAVDRLAKFSKMALDAGIAERQVNMAEMAGGQLAPALQEIFTGLELSLEQEQRLPELVRAALERLEGVNPAGRAMLSA